MVSRLSEPSELGLRHQFRQLSLERDPDFLARFAELGGDERQPQRCVDLPFRPGGNDAAFPRQALRPEAQPLAAGERPQGREMGSGAGGEQQSDPKARRRGDVNDQLIALLDRPVGAGEVRVDSHEREVSHEFTAPPELSGGRQVHPIGMLPGDRIGREAECRLGAMQMAALRSAVHLDAPEDLGLEGGAKSLGRGEATASRRVLQIGGGSDPQFLVELAHPLAPQPGDAQHVEDAGRKVLPHRLQPGMVAGFVELGDHAGKGIADTRNFGEPAFGDQPLQRQRAQRQVVGGAAIGPRAIGIVPGQFQPLGQLPQEP
jgi:hypothetical protein